MKRLNFSLTASLALLSAGAALAGPAIGVEFLGRGSASGNPATPGVGPADVAGVVPQAHWNTVDNNYGFTPANAGETTPLTDSNGNPTAVTLTFYGNDSWYNDVDEAKITNPNAVLMNGLLKANTSSTQTFQFNHVPEGQYDLYVYLSMNGDGVTVDVSDWDKLTTFYVAEWHSFVDTNSFVQAHNTDTNGVPDTGSYVVFHNLGTYGRGAIGASVSHVAKGDGSGVPALQLVNIGPAAVNVNPVTITSQPANRRPQVGDTNVVLSIQTTGPVFNYQWYKNQAAIPGANASSYTLPPVAAGDNGAVFYAIATNNVNSVTSSNAVITVGGVITVTDGVKDELYSGSVRADLEPPGTTPGAADTTEYWPAPDSTLIHPNSRGNNYTDVVSGWFHPPADGNYVFFVSADDDSDFWLSTDDKPANAHVIASETAWSNARQWNTAPSSSPPAQKRSDTDGSPADPNAVATQWPTITWPGPWPGGTTNGATITLKQANSYYFAVVHHQGGGGDPVTATYKLASDADPADGSASALVGAVVSTVAHAVPDGAYFTFDVPPTNVTGLQSRPLTLSVQATGRYYGDDVVTQPIQYQWQSAPAGSSTFANIPGAAGASYTTPLLKLSDAGTQFRVKVSAPGISSNSPVATVAVTPDTVPPLPSVVNSVSASLKTVVVTFNELLDPASAQTAANYVFSPGNIAATNASLDASGLVVTLTTAAPVATSPNTNTLAITGVKDLAGNASPAGTSIQFTAKLVTYEDDIKFDGPVAFFRFEEAAGAPKAKNSGSSGIDGVYSLGDEGSPGAGSPGGAAVGDPGPRPPAFVGFAADNKSATFDGASTWVDTTQQYLQKQAAFSLEYWVSPERTNTIDGTTWGNRVGIVGQNDAIEYGFIDPQTIQIWTPNGGSINSTYAFPDDEWHHVATIADGTSIKTYFDGKLVTSGGNNANGNYGTSGYNVHIGGGGVFDATGNWFKGHIDEVAIFLKGIPADRIAAHYAAGKEGGVITTSGAVSGPAAGPATLSAAWDATGSKIILSWTPAGGTLQSSPALTGAAAVWTDVGAANPATITPSGNGLLYRVRQ